MTVKRKYPHVGAIKDIDTQQALRIAFDHIYDQLGQVQEQNVRLSAALATQATHSTTLTALERKVNSIAQPAAPNVGIGAGATNTGGGSGGGTGGSSGTAGFQDAVANGCAQAGSTGHIDPSLPKDGVAAGMIICGVAVEWNALLAPVADQATRDANALTFIERVIWHLNTQGFTAGRQRNPSGLLSSDKISIYISGTLTAFDILSLTSFDQYMPHHIEEVGPAVYVVDGGTPD